MTRLTPLFSLLFVFIQIFYYILIKIKLAHRTRRRSLLYLEVDDSRIQLILQSYNPTRAEKNKK